MLLSVVGGRAGPGRGAGCVGVATCLVSQVFIYQGRDTTDHDQVSGKAGELLQTLLT